MGAGVKGGKIKWHRHTAGVTPTKFVAMTDQFVSSLAAQGITVGPETARRYRDGVRGEVRPREAHLGLVARGEDKWERNYLAAMAR